MGHRSLGTKVRLGPDFVRAFEYANSLHANDTRKGTDIPYVSHLLAVAAGVLERGGDEEQAIAALLHDAVEDHSEETSFAEIEQRFGARVAKIVRACSDSELKEKDPWCERKTRYIDHLRNGADPDALLVSSTDKLHNARAILADVRRDGLGTLERFRGKRRGTLWYYRSLVEEFRARGLDVEELDRVVTELESIAGERVEGTCPDEIRA